MRIFRKCALGFRTAIYIYLADDHRRQKLLSSRVGVGAALFTTREKLSNRLTDTLTHRQTYVERGVLADKRTDTQETKRRTDRQTHRPTWETHTHIHTLTNARQRDALTETNTLT